MRRLRGGLPHENHLHLRMCFRGSAVIANVVSVSGGKDSTALLLLALERGANPIAVFADTGHEHPLTYEYLNYLRSVLGVEIRAVRADFTKEIDHRREYVAEKWPAKGVPQALVDRAAELLHPTGVPFLDMCLWKARFPSTASQFCTGELKVVPITMQVVLPLLSAGREVWSWQGVRADESPNRAKLTAQEWTDPGITVYRPILTWTAAHVFDYARRKGIKPNPLYLQGMSRVGCMPCVNCRKDELREIAARFPEQIERVREWERIVSEVCRRFSSTFFPASVLGVTTNDASTQDAANIHKFVEWSKTSRGNRNLDLLKAHAPAPMCASNYGLCE